MKERKEYQLSKTFENVDDELDREDTIDLLAELCDTLYTDATEYQEDVKALAKRTKPNEWSVAAKVAVEGTGVFGPDGYMRIQYIVDYGDPADFANCTEYSALHNPAFISGIDVTICADEQTTLDKLCSSLTANLERCEYRRLGNLMSSCCPAMIEQMDITDRYKKLKKKYGEEIG